jgi:beta-lactamase superfamily II metal-dependent hydrolase
MRMLKINNTESVVMSTIKSFAVGNGDTYYIKHNSDNFTIIDCYLFDDKKESIVNELISESDGKGIKRFISTHPDEDHILGLEYIDEKMGISNFYCVENEATKKDETDDFNKYCELRNSDKAFYIKKGVSRKWMNQYDNERGSSGISILWPDVNNEDFIEQLERARNGESPNNISAIIKYKLVDGVTALWMGDLETDFMEKIKDEVNWPNVDILFAPHHGRKSGQVPKDILKILNPKMIVIGEAPSEHIHYYTDYNTITQNMAGDITFDCLDGKIRIYVSNENYNLPYLDKEDINDKNYVGTINL